MNFDFKYFIFFSLTLAFSSHLTAQSKTVEINVGWGLESGLCQQCDYNREDKAMFASQVINLNLRGEKQFDYVVESVEYFSTAYNTNFTGMKYPESADVKIKFSASRGEHFLVSTFNPIVSLNGAVKKVKKIKLKVNYTADLDAQNRAHVFASESILRKGSWYKIGINKSGVFKLDKSFLESIGVSTSGLNPNHINIYGNHQTHLPIINSKDRPDDLLKNSIYIEGENDQVFNDNDYVLFYATGPIVQTPIFGQGFNYSLNNYDSLAYYYLSIDASEPPKRLSSISDASGIANSTTNAFNEVTYYEKDNVNLLWSGDLWLGEEFDINKVQNFELPIPNVVTEDLINLKTSVAAYSPSGTRKFLVSVNDQLKDVVDGINSYGSYTKGIVNVSDVDFAVNSSLLNVKLEFDNSNPASIGWLNFLQINYRRYITNSTNQIVMRDWNSVATNNITNFTVSSPKAGTVVWEVTDPSNAKSVNTSTSGSSLVFKQTADSLRTYTVFSASQAYTPTFIGAISNQNIHGLPQADYLIVMHEKFRGQAERLANLHRGNGLTVHLLSIQDVYNEFSSGIADPISVRWLSKMFYDRASVDPDNTLKSLLLFGDGSYDALNRLENNEATNLLPTYQNKSSVFNDAVITLTNSFTSDDFFGILDDNEAMDSNDLIDIGIGRFPVHTEAEAKGVVDKIEHYMSFGSKLYSNTNGVSCGEDGFASTLGDWRTKSLLIADDENSGDFVKDCESLSDTLNNKYQSMNIVKVYLDAFQQEATSSGQRYPEVENAINQIINSGALVANYVGHGGELGLAAERILSIPMMKTWTNIHKLPLFVSATCEFSRFDDPKRVSAGELMLTLPYGGAVGLLTTTRLVYITTNSYLIRNLYSKIYDKENSKSLSFGEILRLSKNLTAGGDNNFRNFTLLGDPALTMGNPNGNIVTKTINGTPINQPNDTLKALSKITVEGEVLDDNDVLISDFNGTAYPTVYDKSISRVTLSQDTDSPSIPFKDRSSVLYKGKSTVTNGKFSFSFIVPKDINYTYGYGKLSFYAENGTSQRIGYDTTILIGGIDPNGINDTEGPMIDLFMNDVNFVNGGITSESPIFIAKVSDENGINTTGNGIGHDISLIIDGETAKPIILNNFYEADLDTYQSGSVNYQLLNLEEGTHTATFKVWDVNNNSSEMTLNFDVKPKEDIAISHLLNYPNPFTTRTEFFFEHNQVCNSMETKVEIFTISGRLVKTILKTINSSSFRTTGIVWDARDDYGDKLAKGVYVYRLSIETDTGEKAEKLEKLVIL